MNWTLIMATTIAVTLGTILAGVIIKRVPALGGWEANYDDDDDFYDDDDYDEEGY